MSHIISAGCKTVKIELTADKARDFFLRFDKYFWFLNIFLLENYREILPSSPIMLCTKDRGTKTKLAENALNITPDILNFSYGRSCIVFLVQMKHLGFV